jgi:hypothetical protein
MHELQAELQRFKRDTQYYLKGARNPRRIPDFMKKQCVAGLTQLQNRYPLAQRIVDLPYGIATPRSRAAAPVPKCFWFIGRRSPQAPR